MKISTLSLLLAAATFASASPIRIYVLSTENASPPSQLPAKDNRPDVANIPYIRWGLAAADTKAATPGAQYESMIMGSTPESWLAAHSAGEKPARKHRCSGGMRRKFISMSNWVRQKVGLPPIEHHHHHGFHGGLAHHHPVHHNGVSTSSSSVAKPIRILPHPSNSHQMRQSTFAERLQKALLSLQPWEGRVVAFVLGCGIGSLLRMVYVIVVLTNRSCSSRRDEDEVDVLYEVEEVEEHPTAFVDEKPLVDNKPLV